MHLLKTEIKNAVLEVMCSILDTKRVEIIAANKSDLDAFSREDQALYDRLIVDNAKVDAMIDAVRDVCSQPDPVGQVISDTVLPSGLHIVNKTDPFGAILIIYESRPDVTIEAAVLAFKAGNRILLKGGREARHTNRILVQCWQEALHTHNVSSDWIRMLEMDRAETQTFLKNPDVQIDLVVPRGGEQLIRFVKQNAACAVLVSGRGNNFMYVSAQADWEKTKQVVINAKLDKISACNALDKVLFDQGMEDLGSRLGDLSQMLVDRSVHVIVDEGISKLLPQYEEAASEDVWDEEFLAPKIMLASVASLEEAIRRINVHSGHHSSVIMTESRSEAQTFMEQVDSAAVYQNASSRFTDGGAMGVGAELAISTDKLHHRGPLGLKQLVSNKYYVFGDGHIR